MKLEKKNKNKTNKYNKQNTIITSKKGNCTNYTQNKNK